MDDPSLGSCAGKREVALLINRELYERAQALGLDSARVAEAAIARAVEIADREQLMADIRKDREVLARYVAAHGDPIAELRDMFGTP